MIDWLLHIDEVLLLLLNSLQHPALDPVMVFFSGKWVWMPLYALLLYLLYKHLGKKIWWAVLALAIIITLADRLTSGVMKPSFGRLRPCHEVALMGKLNVVDGCGGRYGFPSSHAANTFALAAFFYFVFSKSRKYFWLIAWAVVVSYSRVYLGVHYPLDVAAGALVGWMIGYGAVLILRKYPLKES